VGLVLRQTGRLRHFLSPTGHKTRKTMSTDSKTLDSNLPPTSYLLTPTTIIQILVFTLLFPPLRILKFLLTSTHVRIQKLIGLVAKPPVLCPEPLDKGVNREGDGNGTTEANTDAWAGLRRLGGITCTMTVSVGAVRLLVVTVTIVALTLWVPFYPSARSFFTIFDRLCRAGSSSGGRSGFVVDIRVGS